MPRHLTDSTHSFRLTNHNLFDSVNSVLQSGVNGSSVIIPNICNNIHTFKNGFARKIADVYPAVEDNFQLLGQNFIKTNLGHVQFIDIPIKSQYRHKLVVANMLCHNQTVPKYSQRTINYAALTKCMISISSFIRNNIDKSISNKPTFQIHSPKFGCGFSGGNWLFISELIDDIWSEYTTFIYQPTIIKK
jgi:hypothetical protein